MVDYIKGSILKEEKLKTTYMVVDNSDLNLVEFHEKSILKVILVEILQLMKVVGIPVSFVESISDTQYIIDYCEDIPFEILNDHFSFSNSNIKPNLICINEVEYLYQRAYLTLQSVKHLNFDINTIQIKMGVNMYGKLIISDILIEKKEFFIK